MCDRRGSNRGFTLIEIVVVLAVVAVLAAVMTPAVIKHLNDSRAARAANDVKIIASAITDFYKDLGGWPTHNDANHSVSDQEVRLLTAGTGTLPAQANNNVGFTNQNPQDTMENQLILNRPGGAGGNRYTTQGELAWKGPYLNEIKSDPWGRQYVCNVRNFHPGQNGPVWVLSAGPDGIIQTRTNQRTVQGDDIGFLLRR